jgi:hypothetical protein
MQQDNVIIYGRLKKKILIAVKKTKLEVRITKLLNLETWTGVTLSHVSKTPNWVQID